MIQHETLALGTVIGGKYKVEGLIGAGGMGAVYLVSQVGLGRKAAMKVLHPNLCADAGLTARFHREASLAASIGHDNICEVTDFGIGDGGMPYLVMPLLKGRSLREILKEGPLPYERLCDIMRQVLSALDAAHIAGVVHRDLKPDNIFITKLGDRIDFVKLLDFGISKVLESGPVSELTRTGTVLGTADYMAPEQARGDKTVDHRLDIWAAGVILYEALTGKRPYSGASFSDILLKIVTEDFPPPCCVCPEIPKELETVILKAMARDPADRYVGAREMSEALDRALLATRNRISLSDEAPTIIAEAISASASASPAVSAAGEITARPAFVSSRSNRNRKRRIIGVAAILFLILTGVLISIGINSEDPSPTPMKVPPMENPYFDFGAASAPRAAAPARPPVGLPAATLPTPSAAHGSPAVIPSVSPAAAADLAVSETAASSPNGTSEEAQVAAQSKKTSQPSSSISKDQGASSSAPKVAEPSISTAPTPPSAKQSYSNMNQIKAALREGRITKLQYREYQAEIRRRRAAEYERLKADYRSGAITKYEYETRVDQVHRKYEGD